MDNTLFNNPYLSSVSALQRLQNSPSQDELSNYLRYLQITGQLQSLPENMGYQYGGRVGVTLPTDYGLFRAGVAGGGVNTQSFKDAQVSGGDIGYSNKDRDISLSYQKQSEYGPNFLQLLFKQYF